MQFRLLLYLTKLKLIKNEQNSYINFEISKKTKSIACAKTKGITPFIDLKLAVNSPQYKNKRIVEVTLNDLIVQSISSWANFAGNYQKNYSYNKIHQIPFLQYVKRIYFYQEGIWDDVGFVEINGVYKQGVGSNVKIGRREGWFYYSESQVKSIKSKSSDNQVRIALGCHDIAGSRSDAIGPTVIYFSYK